MGENPVKPNQASKLKPKKTMVFLILILSATAIFSFLKPKATSEILPISPLESPNTTLTESLPTPEETPALISDSPISPLPLMTPAWSKHISLESGFSLEYPGGWTLEEHQGKAETVEPVPSGFPTFGKISIWATDNNQDTDIEKWFANNFAPKPGRPKTGKEPEKIRVFSNKNKVKILEARSNDNARIEYYFLANYAGKVILLAGDFPQRESPEKEASLTALYLKIAESIELQE